MTNVRLIDTEELIVETAKQPLPFGVHIQTSNSALEAL